MIPVKRTITHTVIYGRMDFNLKVMSETYSITKSSVEVYKIRHPKYFYWADIFIDDSGTKGRISIASDFGAYQNYWGACGCSFKEFLCKIGMHYAADKFRADQWFDLDSTIKHYKSIIIEYRRSGSIEASYARKLFDQVKVLIDASGEPEFCVLIQEQPELMKFWDWCPYLSRTVTPQFKNFWEEIWPVFVRELKKEMIPA